LNFIVRVPKNTINIKIIYHTEDVDSGIEIMNALLEVILRNVTEPINMYRKMNLENIEAVESEIKINEQKVKHYYFSIDRTKRNIIELKENINMLTSKIKFLIEKEKFSKMETNGNSEINYILLNYLTYLQNLKYNYTIQIEELQGDSNNSEISIFELKEKLKIKKNELKELNEKKNNLKVFDTVSPPRSSYKPINQNIMSNTVFATVAGFFLFVFIGFFLEKLPRQKKYKE
jgi:hypothetical protein